MKFIAIIPARYASTRFPGKPLADIGGKMMIQRVYERLVPVVETTYVATDDHRIEEAVKSFGGKVVMTSDQHQSGTDRCAEAADKIIGFQNWESENCIILNIQGDEPFIDQQQIELLKSCFDDDNTLIATLIKPCKRGEDIFNPDMPKVVTDVNGSALYFSRSPIPYLRNKTSDQWVSSHNFFNHIGIYAFRYQTLQALTKLPVSALEDAEKLEQNRWLENGYRIQTKISEAETIAVDSPDDIEKIRKMGLI